MGISDLRDYALEIAEKTWKKAERRYKRKFDSKPIIRFSERMVSLGGNCSRYTGEIGINLKLLAQHGKSFADDIVPHEIAHALQNVLHGPLDRSHSKNWKSIMTKLDRPPIRFHYFDTSRISAQRKYKEVIFSNGKDTYLCKRTPSNKHAWSIYKVLANGCRDYVMVHRPETCAVMDIPEFVVAFIRHNVKHPNDYYPLSAKRNPSSNIHMWISPELTINQVGWTRTEIMPS